MARAWQSRWKTVLHLLHLREKRKERKKEMRTNNHPAVDNIEDRTSPHQTRPGAGGGGERFAPSGSSKNRPSTEPWPRRRGRSRSSLAGAETTRAKRPTSCKVGAKAAARPERGFAGSCQRAAGFGFLQLKERGPQPQKQRLKAATPNPAAGQGGEGTGCSGCHRADPLLAGGAGRHPPPDPVTGQG